jgi:hypothetical protein
LVIPPEISEKHGGLIALIRNSESMNDEERQYWINILPVMTEEQIKNLIDILENEKRQLAAIDEKYANDASSIDDAAAIHKTGEKVRQQRESRQSTEQSHKQKEEQEAESILKQIESNN